MMQYSHLPDQRLAKLGERKEILVDSTGRKPNKTRHFSQQEYQLLRILRELQQKTPLLQGYINQLTVMLIVQQISPIIGVMDCCITSGSHMDRMLKEW